MNDSNRLCNRYFCNRLNFGSFLNYRSFLNCGSIVNYRLLGNSFIIGSYTYKCLNLIYKLDCKLLKILERLLKYEEEVVCCKSNTTGKKNSYDDKYDR